MLIGGDVVEIEGDGHRGRRKQEAMDVSKLATRTRKSTKTVQGHLF